MTAEVDTSAIVPTAAKSPRKPGANSAMRMDALEKRVATLEALIKKLVVAQAMQQLGPQIQAQMQAKIEAQIDESGLDAFS